MAKKSSGSDPVFRTTPKKPDWLLGLGWGAFVGIWLVVLAALLSEQLEWSWLLGIVIACALCSMNKALRRALQLGSSIIVVSLGVCLLTPILQPLERALDASESPREADVIVPLGGGFFCGSAELDGASMGRLIKGLELWRAGYAKTITITATQQLAASCGHAPHLEDAATVLVRQLYADAAPQMVLLRNMKTTRTEAEAVAREAEARGWKRILIVTSPTHSRRAVRTFRQLGLSAFVVASSEPRFDSSLRTPHDRLLALRPLVRELAGFVKYGLLGWF